MASCYDTIIGLSKTECDCQNPPAGASESLSGLFLDELEPFGDLDGLRGVGDCGESVWQILAKAREQAITVFRGDVSALLVERYRKARARFSGTIGKMEWKGEASVTKQYAGVRFSCVGIKQATMNIRKVGAMFTGTGTITLKVFNSLNVQVGDDIVVETTASGLKITDVNISLPLGLDFAPSTEYYFVYEYDPDNRPYANVLNCSGCTGFTADFNTANPYWLGGDRAGSQAWANWVMVGGWQGDTLTGFNTAPATTTNDLFGLVFEVTMDCDISEALCWEGLDFQADPLALSIAMAVRFKGAELLADAILSSTNLNRFQMINRELLANFRQEYIARYRELITYIARTADIDRHPCLCAKPAMGMKTVGILA